MKPGRFFDEQGTAVGVSQPDIYFDEQPDDGRAERLETISRVLALLADGAPSPEAVGRRVILLAYVTGASPFKNQRELAAVLGVSEARVSQSVKALRQKLRARIDD